MVIRDVFSNKKNEVGWHERSNYAAFIAIIKNKNNETYPHRPHRRGMLDTIA